VTDNSPTTLCKECRITGHGSITDPFPSSSRIFGPTAWFLETWKRCGVPSREALKKAVEAHNKVATTTAMGRPKIEKQVQELLVPIAATTNPVIRYYQTDQTMQLSEIKEDHVLKLIKVKNKALYKDPITGLLFDRTKDGQYIPVW
jgi:hypothetical protein